MATSSVIVMKRLNCLLLMGMGLLWVGCAPSHEQGAATSSQVDPPDAQSRAIEIPWRASTADEAGLCNMDLSGMVQDGCELSGPWRGEAGGLLEPEIGMNDLNEALAACRKHEDCGGVATIFLNGAPWKLLSKQKLTWHHDPHSYGCSVFLRCKSEP